MTLGTWDPGAEHDQTTPDLSATLAKRFIELSQSQQLDDLATVLSDEEKQVHAGLMRLQKEAWFALAESLNDTDIEHLIRFFTKAEKLPGWDAGEKSPVIWLGKVLKQRGTGISRELTLWIKANSDNRFLPHGPLL